MRKGVHHYVWAMIEVTTDDIPAGPPTPLHPHCVLLPLLCPGPGDTGATGVTGVPQVAGGDVSTTLHT